MLFCSFRHDPLVWNNFWNSRNKTIIQRSHCSEQIRIMLVFLHKMHMQRGRYPSCHWKPIIWCDSLIIHLGIQKVCNTDFKIHHWNKKKHWHTTTKSNNLETEPKKSPIIAFYFFLHKGECLIFVWTYVTSCSTNTTGWNTYVRLKLHMFASYNNQKQILFTA